MTSLTKGYAVASVAAWVGIAVLLAGALALAGMGRWIDAAVLGGFGAGCVAFAAWGGGLPPLLHALFVIAAMLNAAGWAWRLFRTIPGYDEAAHFFTPFTFTLILGFLACRTADGYFRSHPFTLAVGIVSIAIALGALWEIAEFAFGVVETRSNSVQDLLMDSLGAAAAAPLAIWRVRRRCRAQQAKLVERAAVNSAAGVMATVDADVVVTGG